ncbi:zinc-dependent alcohol dehydrogenase [Gluconobacter kanchanaburiensis]|uniref:Dehydrogenase n=1 Tax=Gluconobacter kanchanaburiensis NBRC 103587 TaxID=1307948 RepID=A0A511B6S5_9PROT|nr:alcohol dehydrogenase catalytic domain-containing protein [Gluconobacter kanchanaburiensis]MBF0861733.1 alcohol dehydrogenase catalytic domain-containing protein [Gluconobacter kanchanaburiensis]GBR67331.1 alcohol dehydrogenase [Gluconobacter kanchanaburiensis NBRC 103587]GEK95382.1 dehydrogenase [Gluconobacter kanchanaburiensis NBRC 103587]
MLAARFYGIGDIRVMPTEPSPELKEGFVRVRIEAAGICGSDLHNFRTGQWMSRCPVTPGHELSGTVTQTCGDCAGLVPGDHVVADSRVGCGRCASCRSGQPNLCRTLGFVGEVCDGGFAQEVVLPATQLLRLPADMPLRHGALAEPLAVALHAVHRLAPTEGARIVVCGGGTIGGLAALILRERGHEVSLLERNAGRQALLQNIAGTTPLSADEENWGAHFVLDATGAAPVIELACLRVAPGGRMVLAGLFHQKPQIDFNLIVEREIEILGVSAFADEMPQAIALIPQLGEKLDALISGPHALQDLPQRYEALLAGTEIRLKTLIAPNGTSSAW